MEIQVQKRVVAHSNQIAAFEDFIPMLLLLSKCNHFFFLFLFRMVYLLFLLYI